MLHAAVQSGDRKRYADELLMDLEQHSILPLPLRCRRLTFAAWRNLKDQVHRESGGICFYCGTDTGSYAICDHKIPVARGGTNDFTNLATACDPCNTRKGMLTADEFERKLATAGAP